MRPTHPVQALATACRTVGPRPTIGVIHSAPQQMARSTMRTVRLTVALPPRWPGDDDTTIEPPNTDRASTSPCTVKRSACAVACSMRRRNPAGMKRSPSPLGRRNRSSRRSRAMRARTRLFHSGCVTVATRVSSAGHMSSTTRTARKAREWADWLRATRATRHLTQGELARRVGASGFRTVLNWERGMVPGTKYLRALARELRVTTDELLGRIG